MNRVRPSRIGLMISSSVGGEGGQMVAKAIINEKSSKKRVTISNAQENSSTIVPVGPDNSTSKTLEELNSQMNLSDGEIPLERGWMFWLHKACFDNNYGDSRYPLHNCPIETVQQFWCHFNNLPKPSDFFFRDGIRGEIRGQPLEGLSFFEKNTFPDWESKRNLNGNTITFKSHYSKEEIDSIWLDSLVVLIGETCCHSENITGIRVIDRTVTYRLEIWLDTNDAPIATKVKEWFIKNVFHVIKSPITTFNTPHVNGKKTIVKK